MAAMAATSISEASELELLSDLRFVKGSAVGHVDCWAGVLSMELLRGKTKKKVCVPFCMNVVSNFLYRKSLDCPWETPWFLIF